MTGISMRRECLIVLVVAVVGSSVPALAAVNDLAAEFVTPPTTSPSTNPSGPWTYGYMSSGSSTFSTDQFIMDSSSNGFVAYTEIGETGGGGGPGWTKIANQGFGFPFAGVWTVPPTDASAAAYPGLTDFPSAEGENPSYPNGVLGGHAAACTFCSGWYAVKYTASSTGPVDIEVKAWQTALYPGGSASPGSFFFGYFTRPQQALIQKQSGSTYTNLLRSPMVTRHGWTNRDGTPEYTANDAPTPGDAASYATQQDEIDAAMRSSAHPNLYRLTNVQLNAGESLIISYAGYQTDGAFLGFNAVVRTGADRIATQRWDLSDDWSTHGSTATGIGPDGAWSYGILTNGSFTGYDQLVYDLVPDDANTPERENNGWGISANSSTTGWFVSSAINATGPIVPGMAKATDGINMAVSVDVIGDGMTSLGSGDWPGGKVALHTPPPEVDADQTSVVRWTAPRDMTVNASGGLWRLTLPDGTDRRHQYELLRNGVSIASGTIEELGFDCGAGETNSACAENFAVNSISVSTGDTLDLQISPLQGGGSAPGDYNNDGVVDAADYTVWRDGLGTTFTQADYDVWKANFGATGGGGSAPSFVGVDFTVTAAAGSAAAVPEPGTLVILLMGGAIAAICSMRK